MGASNSSNMISSKVRASIADKKQQQMPQTNNSGLQRYDSADIMMHVNNNSQVIKKLINGNNSFARTNSANMQSQQQQQITSARSSNNGSVVPATNTSGQGQYNNFINVLQKPSPTNGSVKAVNSTLQSIMNNLRLSQQQASASTSSGGNQNILAAARSSSQTKILQNVDPIPRLSTGSHQNNRPPLKSSRNAATGGKLNFYPAPSKQQQDPHCYSGQGSLLEQVMPAAMPASTTNSGHNSLSINAQLAAKCLLDNQQQQKSQNNYM